MTDRLTPVGSWGGAEAWWGFDMVVEIVEDDRVGDIAAGG
jgi:hypothetical protein